MFPPATLPELFGGGALATFLLGQLLSWRGNDRLGRGLASVAWVLFAGFWASMLPVFFVEMKSAVETVLALVVIPVCLLAARALWRGREGMTHLSQAIAVTGLLYGTVLVVPGIRRFLVETVATHTEAGIRALGYDVVRRSSPVNGFYSEFVFTDAGGHEYVTFIILACTGIGAMTVFTGLIAAVRAPLKRKLRAVAAIVVTIWLLNVARNVFIAVAFGQQWFQADLFVALTRAVGYTDPALASYFVADRVISQSLSVVAVVGIALLLLRLLPETKGLFETVVYLVTGRRYSLGSGFRPERSGTAEQSD